jgi:CelD/BcsL family acetyltransferase involved in cellulose biosynthesis
VTLRTEVIRDARRLGALSADWSELLSRSPSPSPSMSPLWVGAWWEVFGGMDGRELRAVSMWEDGRLVGLAPLSARRVWCAPGVPTWRLELIPSGEREADEILSDYLGVVAERGFEQRVAEALAALLGSGGLGHWDELVMPRMGTDSAMAALLAVALHRAGRARLAVTGGSPYIPLPTSWDEYLGRLSASGRRLVRSGLRDFERWSGGSWELRVARTPEELALGARVLRELHEMRWRRAGRPGAFASARFSAFHARVMPALLARGELELMWLCVAGGPVAAVYNIVWNGAVHFYQSGRRPDLPRPLRPGLVLHALAIRRAIELGRREYDFLAGGARFKQELALAMRPLCSLRVVRPRPLDRARRLYERTSRLVRAAIVSRRNPQARQPGVDQLTARLSAPTT